MQFVVTRNGKNFDPPVKLYLNTEDISSFYYDNKNTVIHMIDGDRWEIEGDLTVSLLKVMQIYGKVAMLD